ncbi:MAG TPA: ABC transporter permease [Firmicutes bacterium]|jgi:cell division transport system permease protein|nr:ABC transporter permease [Bacillota bacterium]HAA37352.1 ABC transporter permease [Bacillota bacterium]
MNINSFKYCLRDSFVSLRRNFWLAVVTASIIAVSLAILGGFLLLTVNAGQFIRDVEANVEIAVFLQAEADVQLVEQQLQQLSGIESITFISKEDGLADFSASLGDPSLLAGLKGADNPLPDAFLVKTTDASLVSELTEKIRSLPGVEMADYGEELVARLLKLTGWLNKLFVGVSILLALGAVFLIITTIRLSVLARQEEIGIMKYLGASDWYIRFPFLLEGMAMGWIGTLASTAALGLAYSRLAASLQQDAFAFFIRPVTAVEQLVPIFLGLLCLGTLMGGLGSVISVRKYLRV